MISAGAAIASAADSWEATERQAGPGEACKRPCSVTTVGRMAWWVSRSASARVRTRDLPAAGAPRRRAERAAKVEDVREVWSRVVREDMGKERQEGSGEEAEEPQRRRRRESSAACRPREKGVCGSGAGILLAGGQNGMRALWRRCRFHEENEGARPESSVIRYAVSNADMDQMDLEI